MSVYVNNCLHPQVIYRRKGINPSTGKHFTAATSDDLAKWSACSFEELPVRCGKCINCIKAKARSLVARCVAESRMHDSSAFVTLTFDDESIGRSDCCQGWHSLFHRPFQLFFKRLRKRSGIKGLKYMMCGEYGELSCRPHYHAIIFGLPAFVWSDTGVPDKRGFGNYKSRSDNPIFRYCWPFGDVFLGDVSPASVSYVCGYTCKQFVLGRDDKWYADRFLAPEYVRWSRRPGLGSSYFEKFGLDLVSLDDSSCGVSIDGSRWYAGRYFADWLRLHYPAEYDKLLSGYESDCRSRAAEIEEFDQEFDRMVNRTTCFHYSLARSKRS